MGLCIDRLCQEIHTGLIFYWTMGLTTAFNF